MPNNLSPAYIRLTYSGITFPHHATLAVNVSGTPTPGSEPTLIKRDTTTVGAIAGLAGFLAAFGEFFHSSTLFGLAEVHTVDPDTLEDQFIFGWDADLTGLSDIANKAYVQLTGTFKTTHGGLLKILAMEGIQTNDQKLFPPFVADTPYDILSTYLASGDCVIWGRDNHYAFAPISFTAKENDVLRKRAGL